MKIILSVCAVAILTCAAVLQNTPQATTQDVQALAFGSVIAICLYLIPAITAETRRHRQQLAILMLNLLLGWTLLGWVGAMVWACTSDVAPYDPKNDPWAKRDREPREWRIATAFKSPQKQIQELPIND